VAEGGGLLNRYRLVKAYRGFESLRLRHLQPLEIVEERTARPAGVCHGSLSQPTTAAKGLDSPCICNVATALLVSKNRSRKIIGQAEVRRSLRTNRQAVAKQRAGQFLVALENIYAVLRSEHPLKPTKILVTESARDALINGSSTIGFNPGARRLQQAVDALGTTALPLLAEGPQTLVAIEGFAISAECLTVSVSHWADSTLRARQCLRRSQSTQYGLITPI
jgi:hypothetical protein